VVDQNCPCTWDRKFIYSFLVLAIAFRSSGHVTPAFLAVAFAVRLAEPTRKRGLEQTNVSILDTGILR
jgi:hypothetical protein